MQIPEVTSSKLRAFLDLFDQDLDDKPENLYNGQFLLSVRFSNVDESTFVVGRVAAEMKKRVVYKVDIKFDSHGVPQETQCESAVGMGPTVPVLGNFTVHLFIYIYYIHRIVQYMLLKVPHRQLNHDSIM